MAPLPRQQPWQTRPTVVACSSALLGFVTGAVFWHSIGFWSFVSTVVLKGTDEEVAAQVREIQVREAQTAAKVPVHLRPTGALGPARPTATGKSGPTKSYQMCSLAVPDDTIGEAQVLPCPAGTLAAPTKPLARKGDLLSAAASEPTVNQPAHPAAVSLSVPQANAPQGISPPRRESAPPQSWAPVIRGAQR